MILYKDLFVDTFKTILKITDIFVSWQEANVVSYSLISDEWCLSAICISASVT